MEKRTVEDSHVENIPEFIPILPVLDTVLLPKMALPLEIDREESIRLVEDAAAGDRIVGLLAVKNADKKDGFTYQDLYSVGTGALIVKLVKTEDGKAHILAQGLSRFEIVSFEGGKPYLRARVKHLRPKENKDRETGVLTHTLLGVLEQIALLHPSLPFRIYNAAAALEDPELLADLTVSIVGASPRETQRILETIEINDRLEEVLVLAIRQLEFLETGRRIRSRAKRDMERQEREYYLRRQLSAIEAELGEKEAPKSNLAEYEAKVEEKKLSAEARAEAERELKRLARMNPSSADYHVALSYLDWLTTLPWNESSTENTDVMRARRILQREHFGLEKPKLRIVEFLAVRKLNPDSRSPILCLVGPPGTGKTSFAQSVARAMGRKFAKMSLGGVRDEAEIRGHRRTYAGALPGRIVQGMRRAGADNPVFLLDEIDKPSRDFRGDPSSALLEVLDPEQNRSFVDRYIGVPFDLSKIVFIATANAPERIPPVLRDRMEELEFDGYSQAEKEKIAKIHLVPRQLDAHGIDRSFLRFSPSAIRKIVAEYTREAGVRGLEREIATICRAAASRMARGEAVKGSVEIADLPSYLGRPRFPGPSKWKGTRPGTALGIVSTAAGGEVVEVETAAMPRGLGVAITGGCGDILGETVLAALSFVRSNAVSLHLDENFFENRDVHVHIREGRNIKEGPSTGLSVVIALVSLVAGTPLPRDLAAAGEITLRGRVLPVPRIYEKALAAKHAGMKTVLLPKANKGEIDAAPPGTFGKLRFHVVENLSDAISIAIPKKTKQQS